MYILCFVLENDARKAKYIVKRGSVKDIDKFTIEYNDEQELMTYCQQQLCNKIEDITLYKGSLVIESESFETSSKPILYGVHKLLLNKILSKKDFHSDLMRKYQGFKEMDDQQDGIDARNIDLSSLRLMYEFYINRYSGRYNQQTIITEINEQKKQSENRQYTFGLWG